MENLWKKESSAQNASYVDIFSDIEVYSASNVFSPSKNNFISTQLRQRGNKKFNENLWVDAMDYYNKSLRWAEIGTQNVSWAYANRATCFLHLKMYDNCLIDIEMAKQANYPKELLPKLEKRRVDCLKKMEQEKQVQFSERKLSFEANANFECFADVIEIQQNDEFGKIVTAKRDIPVGKTILIEKTFLSNSGCAMCRRTRMNFIACDHCTIAMYCNDSCKKTIIGNLHNYDCNFVYDNDEKDNALFQLVAQSIFFVIEIFEDVDEMIRFIEETEQIKSNWIPDSSIDAKSKYRLFLTLRTRDTYTVDKYSKYIYMILVDMPKVRSVFNTIQKQQFLKHLVAKHNHIMRQNMISAYKDDHCEINSTLSLVFSLFSHECSPALFNFKDAGQEICITMRPVKKGQILSMSYAYRWRNHATIQRQMVLFKNFNFLCKCDKCRPNFKLSNVIKCLKDPLYQFLRCNRNADLYNETIRTNIRGKCIKLLNKYGHNWFPELDFIIEMFMNSEIDENAIF